MMARRSRKISGPDAPRSVKKLGTLTRSHAGHSPTDPVSSSDPYRSSQEEAAGARTIPAHRIISEQGSTGNDRAAALRASLRPKEHLLALGASDRDVSHPRSTSQ